MKKRTPIKGEHKSTENETLYIIVLYIRLTSWHKLEKMLKIKCKKSYLFLEQKSLCVASSHKNVYYKLWNALFPSLHCLKFITCSAWLRLANA